MRERDRETANHFGILERVEDLERDIKKVNHVSNVDFDLDGFWSDIHQVIIIPQYDIPVSDPNYYDVRRKMLQQIIDVANSFGLCDSGDRIEDYGEHLYIVRDCDSTWKKNLQTEKQQGHIGSDSHAAIDSKVSLSERIQAAAKSVEIQAVSNQKAKAPEASR